MRKYQDLHIASLVVVAVLFGGGGVGYGLANLVVQIVALGLLAVNGPAVAAFVRTGPKPLVALVAASLALPLIQLIPLPPQVWTALPGRAMVAEALTATGGLGWYPLSVNASRTLVALIGLLAPAAVIALGSSASDRTVRSAVSALFGIAFVSLAFGFSQVLRNSGGTELFGEAPLKGVLFGFIANRNSTAIFFVACLTLMCGRPLPRFSSPLGFAALIGAVLMVVGVVLTQSRTGIVLLSIPLGLFALRLLFGAGGLRGRTLAGKGKIMAALAIALAVGITAVAGSTLSDNSRLSTVLARFDQKGDARPEIWEDARFSAKRFWPVGAGMGTFDEVFQLDESLENLTLRRAGRAHDDYIEIVIEGGIVAVALVCAWLAWTLAATWRALASARRWEAISAAGVLAAVALQSVLDYPLRNQTMLVTTALAVVLLARAGRRNAAQAEQAA